MNRRAMTSLDDRSDAERMGHAPRASSSPLFLLRVGWLLFAIVLCITVWASSSNSWRAGTLLPWIIGLLVLWGPRSRHAASGWQRTFDSKAVAVSALFFIALLVIAAWLFSLLAGMFLAVWGVALVLGLAASDHALVARTLLERGALILVSLTVLAFGFENLLHRPELAGQLGLPSEQRRVDASYDHLESKNIFGLRSPYEQLRKPHGVRRVIAIGDSFTWGDHILKTEGTWPYQLERLLQSAWGGNKVEVVNMGQRGYTTVNEVEAIERLGWQFDPDLIVVQWLVNDVYRSGPDFERDLIWPEIPYLVPKGFRVGAVVKSDLHGLLQQRYMSWRLGDRYAAYPALYVDSNPNWIANKRAFRELGESARTHGVPVVVMVWPAVQTKIWTEQTHPHRKIHEMVGRVAEQAGLHVLQLTPAFAAAGGDPRRFWIKPYDQHPNPTANALVVNTLAQYLKRENLIAALPQETRGTK